MKSQEVECKEEHGFTWALVSLVIFGLLGAVSVSLSADDTWTQKSDMPTRRCNLSTCVVDGKIYAIGGWDGANVVANVEVYDPETDTWTRKADMPTPRSYLSTCAVNGRIYAIGGWDKGPDFPGLSTVEEYDPASDTWTRKADMPTARLALVAVAVNGKIYAIGGTANWKNGPDLSTVEEYDPETDTWTRKADMLAKRYRLSAAVVNGKIYAIGGTDYSVVELPMFHPPEVCNPATDTWTELAAMQVPRDALSSSVVNGKIYAIGGEAEGELKVPTVEEYTPEDWQPEETPATPVYPQSKLATMWGSIKRCR
jgi:N-acetylneuraminic acid mutarotase